MITVRKNLSGKPLAIHCPYWWLLTLCIGNHCIGINLIRWDWQFKLAKKMGLI